MSAEASIKKNNSPCICQYHSSHSRSPTNGIVKNVQEKACGWYHQSPSWIRGHDVLPTQTLHFQGQIHSNPLKVPYKFALFDIPGRWAGFFITPVAYRLVALRSFTRRHCGWRRCATLSLGKSVGSGGGFFFMPWDAWIHGPGPGILWYITHMNAWSFMVNVGKYGWYGICKKKGASEILDHFRMGEKSKNLWMLGVKTDPPKMNESRPWKRDHCYINKISSSNHWFPASSDDISPWKLTWQWKKNQIWRCISYQKLGDVPASSHVSFPEGNVVLYPVPNSARNLHTKKVDRLSRTHSMLHLLCMWSSSRRRSKDTSLKKNIFNWIAKVFRCFHEFPTAQQKPWTLNL